MPYRRIPSLNWLRVFEAAARGESFSGAARLLNMSPAAVSQQIKALEGHLETPLFERGARNVTLTDAGAAFLPVVRQSLLSVETTAASLFGHRQGASVTVQATLIFATGWLIERLPDFERQHSGIELHLVGGYHEAELQREGPDLSVIFGTPPRGWGDADPLFGETIYPLARPEIAATIEAPRDVLDHRLIEISTHRIGWLRLFEEAGLTDPGEARFCFADTSEIALRMAAAGHGIALARAPATDGRERDEGLRRCWGEIAVSGGEAYHLVCRSRATLSRPARQFRDWLLEASRDYR